MRAWLLVVGGPCLEAQEVGSPSVEVEVDDFLCSPKLSWLLPPLD